MIKNMTSAFSINKFGESINEDAILVKDNLVAVSDGAGGGGVYADEWSRYLLDNLPEKPFESFEEFDSWVNSISDAFYDEHEELAKQKGGLFLEKFYDEGSFATLAAIWRINENEFVWATYGDSVAFVYDPTNNSLEHSFTHLDDFNKPPHLVSLISPLDRNGFRLGRFTIGPRAYVFVASDALAHYIIARYLSVADNREELDNALDAKSRNSSYVKSIQRFAKKDFYEDVILKLSRNSTHKTNSERILKKLYKNGMIGLDDYSLAFMPKTGCDTEYDDSYIATHLDLNFPPVDSRPNPRRLADYNYLIDNLDDYKELKESLACYQSYMILYRGHADYDWPLIPSLVREPVGSFELERLNYPELRDFLISKGYERFRLNGFNEELYFLGIGRHLGLKSRLLDWTAGLDDSIDAFLLDNKRLDLPGALWIMLIPRVLTLEKGNPFDISDKDIHVFKEGFFSPDGTSIKDFPEGLLRRFRQHGYFTATSEDVMKTPLDVIPSINGIQFVKMKITPSLKAELVNERDNKIYQPDHDAVIDYETWYMGEDHSDVNQIIQRMNSLICKQI